MSASVFEYRAMDKAGKSCRGTARASDREAAYRQLVSMGLTPVWMKSASPAREGRRSRRVKLSDIAQFTHQLGVLIEARIPLSDGLMSIAEQETNERLRRVLMDIAARVQAGQSIASAMGEHKAYFSDVYLSSMYAAERTGNLVKVMGHLSEMLERMQETSRQVRSALTYPLVVVSTLALATGFLVVFAVPRFAKMFSAKGIELPFLTRALMTVGESVQSFWWAYLLGAAAGVLGLRRAWRTPAARASLDELFHRIPVLRSIIRGVGIARFMRVLSLCISSGIGLIEALEMSGKASGRPMLMADAAKMISRVRAGGRLSDVLGSCDYLPTFARRMIAAGETSGEIPKMCDTVARQYERETSMLTRNIGTIIEPVLVVLIAGVVLMVALAIFLPMWDMVRLMS